MYGVIYEGEFDENAHKYFPKELIERQIKINSWSMKQYNLNVGYYLGIDPARFGKSKAAFAVAEYKDKENINLVHGEQHPKTSLLDLVKITEKLNNLLNFRKIFIDDGGFGAGLVDILVDKFKRKIRPLNNKTASGKDKILKEDLYSNTLRLLEEGKLNLVNNKEVIDGLLGVEVEGPDGEEKINGTDMSEAITRACWCSKEKSIKPFIISF